MNSGETDELRTVAVEGPTARSDNQEWENGMKEPETLWKATAQAALIGLAGAAAMFATEMLLFPGVVRAADVELSVDAECVKTCLTDLRTCLAQARGQFVDCSVEGGCVELAAAARTACAADKTASICLEAHAAYSDCITPCRQALRQDVRTCQNASLVCLRDQCGLTDLPAQCRRVNAAVTVP